ncbi:hypothetical protein [Maridesulfovibrio sp.]|uniref:hypothetical protein n=1 Tax=Maridesulfovibrio sp. TaxID=2795000 RepID=UPI003B0087B1
MLKRIAAIFLILITILVNEMSFPAQSAAVFNLDHLQTTKSNNAFLIYDYIFPVLISGVYISPQMPIQKKITTTVEYVNFYSTPRFGTRYKGLGTGLPFRDGASMMLSEGNLLCSEQSALGTAILEQYLDKIGLIDVSHHTFNLVNKNGRWFIMDPYADMRIKNNSEQLASFANVTSWLNGNKKILKLPNKILPRTQKYLELYRPKEDEKYRFGAGEAMFMDKITYDENIGVGIDTAVNELIKVGHDISQKKSYPYLIFVRNNIAALIKSYSNSKQTAWRIQDYFYKLIQIDINSGKIDPSIFNEYYFARGYQLLGRYQNALNKFNLLPQTEQTLFFMSQCYFKLGDKRNFNSYAEKLKKNPFYRYMYYQMNDHFLLKTDKDFFNNFLFKHINYKS